jgi:hypothetical protein
MTVLRRSGPGNGFREFTVRIAMKRLDRWVCRRRARFMVRADRELDPTKSIDRVAHGRQSSSVVVAFAALASRLAAATFLPADI